MRTRLPNDILPSEITPESRYLTRRELMAGLGAGVGEFTGTTFGPNGQKFCQLSGLGVDDGPEVPVKSCF